jgi:nucleoside-diphosphate-sugar epimerase
MVKPGRRPRVIRNPAKPGVGHQWAYLPDLAETLVQLIEHEPLPAFARFNMNGHWDGDGRQMAAAIVRAFGQPEVRVRPFPWGLLSLIAPFAPDLKELVVLRYLWERPMRLRNHRLIATLKSEPHTPLDEAVRTTIASICGT